MKLFLKKCFLSRVIYVVQILKLKIVYKYFSKTIYVRNNEIYVQVTLTNEQPELQLFRSCFVVYGREKYEKLQLHFFHEFPFYVRIINVEKVENYNFEINDFFQCHSDSLVGGVL